MNNNIFLKIVYLPESEQVLYDSVMKFSDHITIIGNKNGLSWMINKIDCFIENGKKESVPCDFDFTYDLAEGSVGLRLKFNNSLKFDNQLKTDYIPESLNNPIEAKHNSTVIIIGNENGFDYMARKIEEYLISGDCKTDNLNFDIGADLSDDSIEMDIVYDEECFFKRNG